MNGIEGHKSQSKKRFQHPVAEFKQKNVTIVLDYNPMNKINMHESIMT